MQAIKLPQMTNQAILKHYHMNEMFPREWDEQDTVDQPRAPPSDRERTRSGSPASRLQRSPARSPARQAVGGHGRNNSGNMHGRTGSGRYSILQDGGIRKIAGAGLSVPGGENNTLLDEPDPLGKSNSVVAILRENEIGNVENNMRLRNKYLISSKTFSPGDFLRDVHMYSDVDDLQNGLEYLTNSINQKSSALKLLVSNNFERFVLAKSTIDSVYKEMRAGSTTINYEGEEEATFRLIKEEEWGLKTIRTPLNAAQAQAETLFGPVMENQEREDKLRFLLKSIDKYREVFDMSGIIVDAIKRKDYDTLKEEYFKAKSTVESARAILVPGRPPTELDIHRIIIAERMWAEVEEVIKDYKRETYRRLMETSQDDNFIDLIAILLELGVEENPIWVWLISRYDALKAKITTSFERSRMEIEALRRRVAVAPEPAPDVYAHYLRSPMRRNADGYDTPLVMAFWELLKSIMTATLSPSEGLLGELVGFWTIAQNFIDGKTQKNLPIGHDEAGFKHHHLTEDKIAQLRKGGEDLLNSLVSSIIEFFNSPPIEDISALMSPTTPMSPDSLPPTPSTGVPQTPMSATMNTGQSPDSWLQLQKRSSNLPTDGYAFLPPNGNSVAGTYYLAQILGMVGTAAAELAKLPIGRRATDQLRMMVATARERAVHGVCFAWQKDSSNFKVLEDWTRSSQNKAITKLPSQFLAVERAIVLGLQEILHVNRAKAGPDNPAITPPAASLVAFVRQQFRRSLYAALSGCYQNSVKPPKDPNQEEDEVAETVNNNATSTTAGQSGLAFSVDKNDSNVRVLLTLSNLQEIKAHAVPQLLEQFENAFGIPLTEDSNLVKETLAQIDNQLFEAYTRPRVGALEDTIRTGLISPDWIPENKAAAVTPYIHEALLQIVLVHSQVVTTAPTLLQRIVSYMLESFSFAMLNTFKAHPTTKFGLSALLQATLDVEFVNQTLGQFVTQRAQELQSEIYVELDRRSDGPSRAALHKELADLRNVLMGLRRNTRAEFLCFRQKKPTPANGAGGGNRRRGYGYMQNIGFINGSGIVPWGMRVKKQVSKEVRRVDPPNDMRRAVAIREMMKAQAAREPETLAEVQREINQPVISRVEVNKAGGAGGEVVRMKRAGNENKRPEEASEGIRVTQEVKLVEEAKEEVKKGVRKEVKEGVKEEAKKEANREAKKDTKKPDETKGNIKQEVKKTSKRRQEVKIQTMRAQEAEDPDMERFGYGGWAGEFMDKLRRRRRSSSSKHRD
ncbi:hypothetical protein TWF106_003493 [Orbilia oligospora]|uniref:Exocyst complex component EXOC2/Sec5 N-terminal domain-containing protein n=1 Tax=Orbilia oligospora TaxID=2813651 RepID=A0A7C8UE67_ORBOL|nr:hypothetical protein TWF106_003493 [Orbilia oligospora]